MGRGLLSWMCVAAAWLLPERGAQAETCTMGNTPCECSLQDGRSLDITPISNAFRSFPSSDQQYTYAYGPCGDVLQEGDTCVPANDPASCQNADKWYNIGRSTGITVDVDTSSGVTMSTWIYSGGDDGRQTVVVITCDETQPTGTINDSGEHPDLTYNFMVTSAVGCLKGSGPQPTQPQPTQPQPGTGTNPPNEVTVSISIGTVMCIIAIVCICLYLVGGVLLMKFHRGAQGLEMIPNRDLWVSIPGLIKDGALFVVSPCRGDGKGDYEKL